MFIFEEKFNLNNGYECSDGQANLWNVWYTKVTKAAHNSTISNWLIKTFNKHQGLKMLIITDTATHSCLMYTGLSLSDLTP